MIDRYLSNCCYVGVHINYIVIIYGSRYRLRKRLYTYSWFFMGNDLIYFLQWFRLQALIRLPLNKTLLIFFLYVLVVPEDTAYLPITLGRWFVISFVLSLVIS